MATDSKYYPRLVRRPSKVKQQEQLQERSFLASLFQPPSDPVDAQIEQDRRFGHPLCRSTNLYGSFIAEFNASLSVNNRKSK